MPGTHTSAGRGTKSTPDGIDNRRRRRTRGGHAARRGEPGLPRDELQRHELLALEDDDALDEVLELAHVTGPRVGQEALEDLRGEAHGLPVVLARVLQAEVLGEGRDLLGPVAERGDEDIDDVEAVVEVLAKGPLGHRLFEVLVGGGDDADVDLDVAVGAQPRELAVLEHLQELGLERQGHLADLVEEHGAAIGELELARLPPVGPGEGAALVAEELGLEQRRRQSRAVDLDAGARAPDGGVVDGAGDELLADPGLAPDEDGDVGVGDLLDHLLDGLHAGTLLEEVVVIRSAALALVPEHLLAELLDLPPERGPLFLAREGPRHVPRRLIVADDDQLGRPGSGRTADSIASSSTWPSNGLRRYAATPDRLTRSEVATSSWAVMRITGIPAPSIASRS